jgi:hypothetical protein
MRVKRPPVKTFLLTRGEGASSPEGFILRK